MSAFISKFDISKSKLSDAVAEEWVEEHDKTDLSEEDMDASH
jgi:hypothetical protein